MSDCQYVKDDRGQVINLTTAKGDLKKNKYPLELLELYVKHVDYRVILKTQVLTAEFCAKHIMHPKLLTSEDEYYMDVDYIIERQPHLTEEEIISACEAIGVYNYS